MKVTSQDSKLNIIIINSYKSAELFFFFKTRFRLLPFDKTEYNL